MAYQVRQRDPLFDRDTQAVLERRGKELLGAGLVALSVLAAMILGSYSQDDPSWLSATDEPARNLLGRFGASLAQPAFMITGWGSWTVPLLFLVWGGRFLLHRGDDRALARAIFGPIAVAIASVYAATHLPTATWTHSFGMGGLFGDTVLGAVLNLLPFDSGLALKFLSLLLGAGLVAFGLFVMGFTRPEVRAIGRFMLLGVVMAYALVLRLARAAASALLRLAREGGTLALGGGRAAAHAIAAWNAGRQAARGEARAVAEAEAREALPAAGSAGDTGLRRPAPVIRGRAPDCQALSVPAGDADPGSAIAAYQPVQRGSIRPSLLSRVPTFLKRMQPALTVPADRPDPAAEAEEGGDRIRARIARAITAREDQISGLLPRTEPPLTRPRGPLPILFDKSKYPPPRLPRPGAGTLPAADETDPDIDPAGPADDDDFGAAPPAYAPSYGVPIPDPRSVVQHPAPRAIQPSRQARNEAEPRLRFDDSAPAFECPPLSLLASPDLVQRHHLPDEALGENARMLESVLDDYGVRGEIVSVRPGPVVTMYELEPAPGLKASRVIGLADDIARSMSALSARVSTVPGRSVIGIELPNERREKVVLREILGASDFGDSQMRLPLALGKDIGGAPVVANLAKMPHLLIAGTTGSGKSVAINTMILSLLYKLSPAECRLIMIDPKMLELSVYDGIPHLLSPVVTDPKKAVVALKWVVGEMEDRYRKMSKMGVRNIEGYNGRVRDAQSKGEMFRRTIQTGFDDETGDPVFETEEFEPQPFPYIVVIVDEMADLMMVAGKEIEACIQRLAQMARASGIHLIMATQRPSVDVITGTIKANFPTRISFQVTSKIDSRTILGEQGAEQLLGMGDMLYMAGGGRISRVHGPFVSDEEVEEVVNHLKSFGPPEYVGSVVEGPDEGERGETSVDELLGLGSDKEGDEALYDMAVAIVAKDRKCSTSYIQRKLAIGYNKAARLVEQMETNGVVTAANAVGKREILVPEA